MDAFPEDFSLEITKSLYHTAVSQTSLVQAFRQYVYETIMESAGLGNSECIICTVNGINAINAEKIVREVQERGFKVYAMTDEEGKILLLQNDFKFTSEYTIQLI